MGKSVIIQKDGIDYRIEEVSSAGKIVGKAPTKEYKNLKAMLEDKGEDATFSLAVRQMRQDAKNLVRAKATKDLKVADSVITNAILKGEISTDEISALAKKEHLTLRKAVEKLLSVDKKLKLQPDRIFWEIL